LYAHKFKNSVKKILIKLIFKKCTLKIKQSYDQSLNVIVDVEKLEEIIC